MSVRSASSNFCLNYEYCEENMDQIIGEFSIFKVVMNSIKSVIAGGMFLMTACTVLFVNEGCAVKSYNSLKEGAKAVKSVKPEILNASLDGKLVHFNGKVVIRDKVVDSVFQVESNGFKLQRNVQMFQWKEKSVKTAKNSKVNKYTYEKTWSDNKIESSLFKDKSYSNPDMLYPVNIDVSEDVTVGVYSIPKALIARVKANSKINFTEAQLAKLDQSINANNFKVINGELYVGKNPNQPEIGDLKISFFEAKPGPVSVIGRQVASTVEPYQTKSGDELYIIKEGMVSAKNLFIQEEKNVGIRTWAFRGVGVLFIFFAFMMLMNPLLVVARYIPLVGEFISSGVAVLSALLAVAVSAVVIGFSWVFHRPVLGLSLVALAGGCIYLVFTLRKEKQLNNLSNNAYGQVKKTA